MDCRDKIFVALFLLFAGFLLSGCITYQIARYVEGDDVVLPDDGRLQVGETTLGEVLALLGAPDNVTKVGPEDLLVYERALLYRNRIKVGIPIPLSSLMRTSFDASAYGTLVRYDSLALFFNSEGILSHKTSQQGSSHPYFKTLFSSNQ
jgi:hypothetical protein